MNFLKILINFYILCLVLFLNLFVLPYRELIGPISDGLNNDNGGAGGGAGEWGPFG